MLVLSPESPYPTIGGGALRTASLLAYLSARYEVDLVVFREPGAPDPRAAIPPGAFGQIDVLDLPVHSRRPLWRAARNLRRWALGRPPLNDRFAGFSQALEELLRGRSYELALVEHFWCAEYAEVLATRAQRLVLDLHNVESELYGRLAESEPWPQRVLFRRFQSCCRSLEQGWLPRYGLLLATSAEDAAKVRAICPGATVGVYPNAIPHVPVPVAPEQEAVVFTGNLEYGPNASAVRFFRRQIWPLLRERWPRLVWRVIGKNPHAVASCLKGDDRIELVGPVPDAIAALAQAKVVVVPLLAASGTRFKILEAWAAARAVISTSVGAEGLDARDGEHLILADEPRAFAEAVSMLLASEERRNAVGRAGRLLYEQRFTWEAAWEHLRQVGI